MWRPALGGAFTAFVAVAAVLQAITAQPEIGPGVQDASANLERPDMVEKGKLLLFKTKAPDDQAPESTDG